MQAVNTAMVLTYWQVGREIVEEEQSRSDRAEYGERLVETLARQLTAEFGKGFDRSNLWNMRAVYLAFPILDALRSESKPLSVGRFINSTIHTRDFYEYFSGIIHCTVNNANGLNMNLSSVVGKLELLPGVKVEWMPEEDRLLVHASGRTVPVRVVMRASGYPRDVRAAAWQAQAGSSAQETLLICAPALTTGSRAWLQQEGIAYLDAQGNLFLTADGIYILREASKAKADRPARPVETNIFRGRASQVLHSLLHAPERAWHVTDLAAEAGVAPGTAVRVCEVLEKMLLMEREGRGPQSLRRVPKPGGLLDAWRAHHRLEAYAMHRYYRWMGDLDALAAAIGGAIEQQNASYAVTLTLGAMHRAPFVTQTQQVALLYPTGLDLQRLAGDGQLQPAEEGYNVLLLATPNDGPLLYRQKEDALWIASDIQLYLDLVVAPGRGREQAEHLRRERIGF